MLRLSGASRSLRQRRYHLLYTVSKFSGTPTGTLGDGNIILVGQFAEKKVCYNRLSVSNYATLIEDPNPLHTNEESRPHLQPKTPIVHGMLVASIFSSIFGTLIPGSVYLDQTLKFSRPVHIGDQVTGRIEVTRVRQLQGKRFVFCETTVRSATDDSIEHIRGKATVWVPQLPE